jgi:hypothetical protein
MIKMLRFAVELQNQKLVSPVCYKEVDGSNEVKNRNSTAVEHYNIDHCHHRCISVRHIWIRPSSYVFIIFLRLLLISF